MNHPYSRTCRWRGAFVAVLLLTSTASSASAQNYSFDARRIALGGAGGTPNVASKLVERQRRYRSILIPVGLVKVLSNVRVFYPNREDFDFSRAVEFGYSPLHHVFGRREDITGRTFFSDIVQAQLEPDLNAYRGFDDSSLRSPQKVSIVGELGQDVHAARRTTGAFRGFTSARVRISPRARMRSSIASLWIS